MTDRMCIVSRQVLPEDALIRFVLSPDEVVTPDLQRKLPGRGVWVEARRGAIAEAQKRNLFARGFGAKANAPQELADSVGQQLRQKAVSTLSLARKAGEAVTGFMKVEEALRKGPVRILVHSPDAALDGCRKLDRLAQEKTEITQCFSDAELSLAFGHTNVVHAAIAAGGLAESLSAHIRRMASYET
jgi:predicted RNA-binding protein YlxR (DUF448 family)